MRGVNGVFSKRKLFSINYSAIYTYNYNINKCILYIIKN